MDQIITAVVSSLLTAGIIYLVQRIRKPWYLPFRESQWDENTKRVMNKLGYTPETMNLNLESMVVTKENQGWEVVTKGLFQQPVHSHGRNGEELVMMRKC